MKLVLKVVAILILTGVLMGGCGETFRSMVQPLTSPALTEQETAAVKAYRLAHGAVREAAAAVQVANQYASNKARTCTNLKNPRCSALKAQLISMRERLRSYEVEVERMNMLLAASELSSAKLGSEQLRALVIAVQQEILMMQ